jgi:hypothetical protein
MARLALRTGAAPRARCCAAPRGDVAPRPLPQPCAARAARAVAARLSWRPRAAGTGAGSLSDEEAELAADAAALEAAGGDATRAGADAIRAAAGGLAQQVAPKAAEVAATVAELQEIGAAEREVLLQAAALLAKIGMRGPQLQPPEEEEEGGAEEDDEDATTGI